MKWTYSVLLVLAVCALGSAAPLVEPALTQAMNAVDQNGLIPVEFFMKAQANALNLDASIANLPKPLRRAKVREVLEQFSATTQADLLSYLRAQGPSKVEDIRSLWLCNLVSCWATKEVIQSVAARSDVELMLYAKVPVELGKIDIPATIAQRDAVEPNLITTNARGAWAQGYTGQDIVLGVVDTGVLYTHYDLRDHLWTSTEYPNCGFNFASNQFSSGHPGPSTYDTLTPLDFYGHGTHCAGIATADGAYGNGTRDTMGVAPSCKIMSLPVDVYLHSPYPDTSMENNMILGFQFCVSPTRDPTNGADVITTSLGLVSSWLPRRALFRQCEENVMAAGLPHCIAAGNEGPSARTIRCPGDCPPPWPNPANHPSDNATSAVITVGATDNNDNAASFTSIGPTDWGSVAPYNDYAYPPGLMDPDVCAPGVNILSTYNSGDQSYTQMSGTSMATPGVAGCVALMLSKNPVLTPREVDSILEMCAVTDLGPSGKDVTYGAGRINCSLAVACTPFPGPRHDVAIAGFIAPAEKVDPAVPIAPQVRVANIGTFDETGLQIHLQIDSSGTQIYNQMVPLASLDSAETDSVTFPNWTPGQGGNVYSLLAWHGHLPDTNHANDSARRTVTVRGHGMASVGMNVGGRVRALQPFTPSITLRSADYTEYNVDCVCWIDSAGVRIYTDTATADSVPAGGTATVPFMTWNIGPTGATYDVTMYNLFSDPNHADDTLHRTTQATDQMRVLIAYADLGGPPDLLMGGLTALGDSVDLFDAASGTPTLEQLNPYDGVICFSNNTFANASGLGDVLADFVDGGRPVVFATFAVTSGWSLQGRIRTGNYATMEDGSNVHEQGGLGWYNAAHPIMVNVDTVTDLYRSTTTWSTGADSVATWADGKPYIATSPNMRVVAINNYPGYYNPSRFTGSDWILAYHQALLWAAGGGSGLEEKQHLTLHPDFTTIFSRPNPMSAHTTINYVMPHAAKVALDIYDLSGQRIKSLVNGEQGAGRHQVKWNRTDTRGLRVASGIYFYHLKSGEYTTTRKLVVE